MWYCACHSTLLWHWFRDCLTRFRVVCLSIPSVPTLCLKNQHMGNDTIHLELLLSVEVVRWSKLSGCRQLKDKKNSPLTINNYLLKRFGVTIIYSIYFSRAKLSLYYPDMKVFIIMQTAYSFLAVIEEPERERERERKRERERL